MTTPVDAAGALAGGTEVWIPRARVGTADAGEVEDAARDGIGATHARGTIARASEGGGTVAVALADGRVVDVDVGEVLPRDGTTQEDMVKLNHLHEPGVVENLRARYAQEDIYTYTGSILIAVNPFKDVGHLYDDHMMGMYRGARLGDLSPHVFAMADAAYEAMRSEGRSQSVLVSGESGAGKTETAKLLMRYIAHRSSSEGVDASGAHDATSEATQRKVLESNPLLEAFGNAKTVRNDNSSRFGKYVEMQFDAKHRISGAAIRTYLLERSRVVKTSDQERNFHVFYQLCAGAETSDRETWRLKDATEFYYTNQGSCFTLKGVNDAEEYARTLAAMDVIGITKDEQKSIMSVIAGILHLGNVRFVDNADSVDEGCDFADGDAKAALLDCAAVLQLDVVKLERSLRTRRIVLADEVIYKPLSATAAVHSRDALAKSLYSRLFDALVERINAGVGQDQGSESFIGVLDIYGFESFAVNSFEQFCINFANEKLQQHFNQHIFKLEQAEYEKEGIDWSYIEFIDNQDILDVIERRSNGIISLLDESCMLASSTDSQFVQKLYSGLKDEKRFSKPKLTQTAFTLSHYAGEVTYESDSFLDKNKDFVIQEHVEILASSSHKGLTDMFSATSTEQSERSKSSTKFSSVSARFKKQLGELMSKLNSTEPHYIRCIKPNAASKPATFDGSSVLQQLRCGGVLEAIRISCAGYPSRKPIEVFLARYGLLDPRSASLYFEGREKEALQGILQTVRIDGWQIGKTQVFLRAGQMAILDGMRLNKLNTAAIEIQSRARAFVKRKQFCEMRAASIKIAAATRGMLARKKVRGIREEIAALKIQTAFRAIRARVQFQRTRAAALKIQAIARGARARQILQQTRETEAQTTRAAICIQTRWRGKRARSSFNELKAKARETGALLEAKSTLEKQLESERARTAMEHRARQDDNARHLQIENTLRARVNELELLVEDVKKKSSIELSSRLAVKDGEISDLKRALQELQVNSQIELSQLREWKESREAQFLELNSKLEAINNDSMKSPLKKKVESEMASVPSSGMSTRVLEELNSRISEKVELNSRLRSEVDLLKQEKNDLERMVKQMREEMSEIEKENEHMKSQYTSPASTRRGSRLAGSVLSPMSPMDGLETPTTPETPNNDDMEAALEREQAELNARKAKLEQVKSHMEYSILLGFIEKNASEAGFTENGTPVLACIIFRCFLKWGSFELDRTSLFEKMMESLNNSVEAAGEDYNALSYWLSNSFTLLQLLHRTLKTNSSANKENRRKSGSLFERINRLTRATTSTSSPSVGGVAHIDAKYPAFLFKQQLAGLVERIYAALRDKAKKDITPQFATCIQAPRNRPMGAKAPTSGSISQSRNDSGDGWARIVEVLEVAVKAMALNNVPDQLSRRFFGQIFSFINVQMFNALLLRRECCSFSNGEYIKAGLSLLDTWARKPQHEAVGEEAMNELRFIRQAVGLLVIHQKPQKTLNEITLELCPQLSIQQLYRISTMYWDDKYGTESVSADVLNDMRTRMTEDTSQHLSNSFLLDDDSSVQFNIDENIDANVINIQLAGFGLPATFLDNPSFSFLLSRPSEQ